MKKIITIILSLIVFTFLGCGTESKKEITENGPIEVRYKVTFTSNWSAENFKTDFPSNAHFSKLAGVAHNDEINFWKEGAKSSSGVKSIAETGSRDLFIEEVEAAIKDEKAQNILLGGGMANTPGNVSFEFGVSKKYPLITLISMLAPSPDWFLGVHDLNLLGDDGEFVQELSKDLIVYDAGTDSGVKFKSENQETKDGVIAKLTCHTNDCDFANGVNADLDSSVKFLGSFKFERIE